MLNKCEAEEGDGGWEREGNGQQLLRLRITFIHVRIQVNILILVHFTSVLVWQFGCVLIRPTHGSHKYHTLRQIVLDNTNIYSAYVWERLREKRRVYTHTRIIIR